MEAIEKTLLLLVIFYIFQHKDIKIKIVLVAFKR